MIKLDFDISRLIQDLSPNFKGSNLLKFFEALLFPVEQIKNNFILFAESQRVELMKTGRVGNLEALLNDAYDSQQRRINIADGVEIGFVFRKGFIFQNGFVFPSIKSEVDFEVNIPSDFNQNPLFIFPPKTGGFIFQNDFTFQDDFIFPTKTGGFVFQDGFVFPQIDATVLSQVGFIINKYKIAGKSYQINLI